MIDEYMEKWIAKALEDMKIIEHELAQPENEVVTAGVCFHSQQAVEKFLKVYLISKRVDFGRTHDLRFLLNLCIEQDKEFEVLNIGNLTFYAVEGRYPDEFYVPSIEEAKKCAKISSNVKNFVLRKLSST